MRSACGVGLASDYRIGDCRAARLHDCALFHILTQHELAPICGLNLVT